MCFEELIHSYDEKEVARLKVRLMGHIHSADVLLLCYIGQTQHYSLVNYRTHQTQGRPDNTKPLFYFQHFVIIGTFKRKVTGTA